MTKSLKTWSWRRLEVGASTRACLKPSLSGAREGRQHPRHLMLSCFSNVDSQNVWQLPQGWIFALSRFFMVPGPVEDPE